MPSAITKKLKSSKAAPMGSFELTVDSMKSELSDLVHKLHSDFNPASKNKVLAAIVKVDPLAAITAAKLLCYRRIPKVLTAKIACLDVELFDAESRDKGRLDAQIATHTRDLKEATRWNKVHHHHPHPTPLCCIVSHSLLYAQRLDVIIMWFVAQPPRNGDTSITDLPMSIIDMILRYLGKDIVTTNPHRISRKFRDALLFPPQRGMQRLSALIKSLWICKRSHAIMTWSSSSISRVLKVCGSWKEKAGSPALDLVPINVDGTITVDGATVHVLASVGRRFLVVDMTLPSDDSDSSARLMLITVERVDRGPIASKMVVAHVTVLSEHHSDVAESPWRHGDLKVVPGITPGTPPTVWVVYFDDLDASMNLSRVEEGVVPHAVDTRVITVAMCPTVTSFAGGLLKGMHIGEVKDSSTIFVYMVCDIFKTDDPETEGVCVTAMQLSVSLPITCTVYHSNSRFGLDMGVVATTLCGTTLHVAISNKILRFSCCGGNIMGGVNGLPDMSKGKTETVLGMAMIGTGEVFALTSARVIRLRSLLPRSERYKIGGGPRNNHAGASTFTRICSANGSVYLANDKLGVVCRF